MVLDLIALTDTHILCGGFMCYQPNLIRFSVDLSSGEVCSKFIGSCKDLELSDLGTPYVDPVWYLPVPCGKCLQCRLDHSHQWADRLALEFSRCHRAVFVTLTYNNDHVPRSEKGFLTLSSRDCQLFFKRLRKRFPDRRIRYLLCGEYGSRTFRPHYHAIIFNLSICDFPDLQYKNSNELGNPFFTSSVFESIWSNGFCLLSDVSWNTFAYVARYTAKKYMASSMQLFDRRSPFILSSRSPGIGMDVAFDLLKSGTTSFSFQDVNGVRQMKIPNSIIKRFRERLKLDDKNFLDLDQNLLYSNIGGYVADLKFELSNFDGYLYQYFQLQKSIFKSRFNIFPERS